MKLHAQHFQFWNLPTAIRLVGGGPNSLQSPSARNRLFVVPNLRSSRSFLLDCLWTSKPALVIQLTSVSLTINRSSNDYHRILLKASEWSVEQANLIAGKGFSVDPLKSTVESDSSKPLTFTWTPPEDYDVCRTVYFIVCVLLKLLSRSIKKKSEPKQ